MTVTAPQSSCCPGFSESVGLLVLSVLDDELGDDIDDDVVGEGESTSLSD